MEKECRDCWNNYHCPVCSEGYEGVDPDACPYNSDKMVDIPNFTPPPPTSPDYLMIGRYDNKETRIEQKLLFEL